MANHCQNVTFFTHSDKNLIDKIQTIVQSEKVHNELFETFASEQTWGTSGYRGTSLVTRHSDDCVEVHFDTAWSPPIEFYGIMESLGFTIDAYYYEPGMMFCGEYHDYGHSEYDLIMDENWIAENIPTEMDEMFGISECLDDFE